MNTKTSQQHTIMTLLMTSPRRTGALVLMGLIVFMACLYIFFLGTTTSHISERKQLQQDIRTAYSRIADLETEFFAMKGKLTLAEAHTLGYVESRDVVYVERAPVAETFALRVE
jgi:type II secretory pathway component PulM